MKGAGSKETRALVTQLRRAGCTVFVRRNRAIVVYGEKSESMKLDGSMSSRTIKSVRSRIRRALGVAV